MAIVRRMRSIPRVLFAAFARLLKSKRTNGIDLVHPGSVGHVHQYPISAVVVHPKKIMLNRRPLLCLRT